MKIYFCGSICGGREDVEWYEGIVSYLKTYGEVVSERVSQRDVNPKKENGREAFIHNRNLEWLLSSEVVVAEVSTPSLGVGYEIGRAVEQGKKVLCLYRNDAIKQLSAMIRGCPDVTVANYATLEQAKHSIDEFFENIKKK
jgi:nucleoside 2-deoxyribosyltransferase